MKLVLWTGHNNVIPVFRVATSG
jgi:hypothetical protein